MNSQIIFALIVLIAAAFAHDCTSDSETGPCRAFILSWAYQWSTNTCEEFIYGGCQGNDNRYSSITECEQACKF